MRIPAIHYHEPKEHAYRQIDFGAICVLATGIFLSSVVWVLAIAKVVDIYSLN